MATPKKRGMLIWTTGPSGCGAQRYLKDCQADCENEGKKVKIHHLGKMMFSWIWENLGTEMKGDTVLNRHKEYLDLARMAVLGEIRHSLDRDLEENDAVFVRSHSVFYWRGCYTPAYNERFIMSLNHPPDMFVAFIDAAADILKVLRKRDQWCDQDLSEKDLWLWQNIEVDNARRYLYLFEPNKNRRFFVIPVKQPAQTLYRLLFEPWRPIVYAQMPISHVEPHELEKVNDFIKQLWKWCVVFNPLTIETGTVEHAGSSDETKIRHCQTAHRDLEWFIPQCDIALAYWVKVVCSPGVVDETAEASQLGKEAWIIFPGDYSPFIQYRAKPHRIFSTPEEALEFLEKVYMPTIREKWNIK
ncbi:hypothetical protein HY798_01130 [Candidatus Falkowbacteria bacterium]|nr:hypothetical protein [Candidatus Falkowbacteria bacterium]